MYLYRVNKTISFTDDSSSDEDEAAIPAAERSSSSPESSSDSDTDSEDGTGSLHILQEHAEEDLQLLGNIRAAGDTGLAAVKEQRREKKRKKKKEFVNPEQKLADLKQEQVRKRTHL